jgi:hypothetical protein
LLERVWSRRVTHRYVLLSSLDEKSDRYVN